jgi:hypothetical protein
VHDAVFIDSAGPDERTGLEQRGTPWENN